MEDLGGLLEKDKVNQKIIKLEEAYNSQDKDNKNIMWALLSVFKLEYLRSVVDQLLIVSFDLIQPYILSEIAALMSAKELDEAGRTKIIQYAVLVIFLKFMKYFVHEHDCYHSYLLGC